MDTVLPSNSSWEAMADLPKLTEVHILHWNRFGDEHVSRLSKFRKLSHLHLYKVPVTDSALPSLHRLRGLNYLLLNKTQVTAAGVAALRKALPNCNVEWDGEKQAAAARLADRAEPFVITRAADGKTAAFKHLPHALATYQRGDVLTVYGNGPYTIDHVKLPGLILKAGEGYRPEFRPGRVPDNENECLSIKGDLSITGCDFRHVCKDRSFETFVVWGGCEFDSCRFTYHGEDFLLVHKGESPLVVRNCIIESTSYVGGVFGVDRATSLTFENNAISCEQFLVYRERSCQATFARNSVKCNDTLVSLVAPNNAPPAHKRLTEARLEFTDTVLEVEWLVSTNAEQLDAKVTWAGQNLQNEGCLAAVKSKNWPLEEVIKSSGPPPLRIAAPVKQIPGGYATSQSLDYDYLRRHAFAEVVPTLRDLLSRFPATQGEAPIGPDPSMLGAGEPYVNALRKRGSLDKNTGLRPAPPAAGPFVILRQGEQDSAHVRLVAALNAAADGDVVEIRGDGPFPAGEMAAKSGPRHIILRAAPGYRPVIRGWLTTNRGSDRPRPATVLDLEGLSFENGGVGDAGHHDKFPVYSSVHLEPDAFARVDAIRNCSFENANAWLNFAAAGDKAAVIENCVFPLGVAVAPPAKGSLVIRNSVVNGLRAVTTPGTDANLEIDRCAFLPGRAEAAIMATPRIGDTAGKFSQMHITSRGTVYDCRWLNLIQDHTNSVRPGRWVGEGNAYGVMTDPDVAHRKGDSIREKDSFDFEPTQLRRESWRLRAVDLKDGKIDVTKIGADVSRLPPASAGETHPPTRQ